MRILVTGASGFVGSACALVASRAGHEVFAMVRPGSAAVRLEGGGVTLVPADLGDIDGVRAAFVTRPDVVIHAAWRGGVTAADRQSPHQVSYNVAASLTLVETAIASGVRKFIGIGSQAEYGDLDGRIAETSLLEPTSFYGAAKLAVQVLVRQFCRAAGVDFAWLRLFATYGPGDNAHWLIPSMIERMLDGERPCTTSGRQLADYLHIDDVGAAVLAVAERSEAQGVFNLGSGAPVAVRTIIETTRDFAAPGLELVFGEIPHSANQIWHMEADIDRLKVLSGFVPSIGLVEGLGATVAWHRARRKAGTA